MKPFDFVKIVFKGIGQIMLQNNAITGLLFLAGISYYSWIIGLCTLLGVLAGTITAFVLKYKKKDIADGLYGFNGALVGAGLSFFFEVNVLLILLIILGAVISSIVMNFMHEKKLSPYTFPFIISAWFLMALIKIFNLIPMQAHKLPDALNINILSSLSMGFGQVIFSESVIAGILFFIAILVSSRISAVYALVGSALGMVAALALSLPLNMINIGLFGFNGVLCGIAFADKKISSLVYAAISIVISVLFVYGFNVINWFSLTAPFVFATWITLAIRKKIKPVKSKHL